MSKRKPNNVAERVRRASRALLRSNHAAVVNLDPSGWQGMVNYRNLKRIPPGVAIANAICDITHHWTIYLAALCIDQTGQRYIKSVEIAPQGMYKAEALTEVIEQTYTALVDEQNPAHLVGSGWIAMPAAVSLDEEQAAKVFETVGAWQQIKEAA